MIDSQAPVGVEIDSFGNAIVVDPLSRQRRLIVRMVRTEDRLELYLQIEQPDLQNARILLSPQHLMNAIRWAEAKGA